MNEVISGIENQSLCFVIGVRLSKSDVPVHEDHQNKLNNQEDANSPSIDTSPRAYARTCAHTRLFHPIKQKPKTGKEKYCDQHKRILNS